VPWCAVAVVSGGWSQSQLKPVSGMGAVASEQQDVVDSGTISAQQA
jgi:hypothetical protein